MKISALVLSFLYGILVTNLFACNEIEEISINLAETTEHSEKGYRRIITAEVAVKDRGATPGYCLYVSASGGLSSLLDGQSVPQGAARPSQICPSTTGCRVRIKANGITRLELLYTPVCNWAPVTATLYEMNNCDTVPNSLNPPLSSKSITLADQRDGALPCQIDSADLPKGENPDIGMGG